jgi:sugar phosphate isomerase/epimerase
LRPTASVYLQNQLLTPDGRAGLATWTRGPVRYDPIPLHDPRGIDFPAVFAGLARSGYDGTVTVHQALAEIMAPPEAARVSAEYLRTLATFEAVDKRR